MRFSNGIKCEKGKSASEDSTRIDTRLVKEADREQERRAVPKSRARAHTCVYVHGQI